jgi:DNA polymerase III epsilon subunit-like protein
MVHIAPGISELARLSVIDYLTGEVLIDTLVRPVHTVIDWRTEWSGITSHAMNAAVAAGAVLEGWGKAREKLFEFIDEETVIVGHALHHDLASLGIWHRLTVDSAVLTRNAVGKDVKRDWGLKTLCKEFLGIDIQNHGKKGHDSLEDAFAAREVVLWCVDNGTKLKEWGERKRKELIAEGRVKNARQNTKRRTRRSQFSDDESDRYEILSLRELNEMCGLPEWYDAWSD